MRAKSISILLAALTAAAFTPRQEAPPLLGFSAASAAEQYALEARFDAQLDPTHQREWMQRLTVKPFYVGSPGNRESMEWVSQQLREWGFQVDVEEFDVLFPTPRVRELQLVGPTTYTAQLREPTLPEDHTSGVEGRLPTYNAYSVDGDVTGQLVYVNYGLPEDYEELERHGVDVTGKVVIAKYGRSWRGIKPKVAAEHGAIGCIIYSDPLDDGYAQGDVYPAGPYRMAQGVQRGSVLDAPLYPGDPLTPGYGATPDAPRLDRSEAPTLTKIPTLPISYGDALPFLRALMGPVVPASWRGALPITYHMGPGPATVHLHVEFNWDLQPAYDIVARLEGSERPDEWIIRGNHRDGWAMGAGDPTSGLVSLLDEARAVGTLAKSGWRPKRTIVYTVWDGEEPMLLGSTEWAEQHEDELKEKAALYINSDGHGRGFLNMGGSQGLERFMTQVARDVTDPETGVSLEKRRRARSAANGGESDANRQDLRVSPLGTGSDYTPFLQHLGVTTLNLGFGGEGGGGSYHSQFDSFDHFTRFIDPDFAYGVALSKVAGRATLRFAQADVLPFRFDGLASEVATYASQVRELADQMRTRTERENRLVRDGTLELASDPTETFVPPPEREPVPYFNFAPLENAVAKLETQAGRYDAQVAAHGEGLSTERLQELNRRLMGIEQLLTDDRGLPKRPWYRHLIYAPGFYTGYGVKTLPGVREAIEEREYGLVDEQVGRAADAVDRVGQALSELSESLERPIT